MANKLEFLVCRVCLVSSDVANLIDLFEETGETLKKFQEVSKIDILQDKNKYHALICKECNIAVDKAFEVGKRVRRAEMFFFSNLRAKIEKENLGKELRAAEGHNGDEVTKEEDEVVMVNSESEKNMTIEISTMKEELFDDLSEELLTELEFEEETFQEITEENYQNSSEEYVENETVNTQDENIDENEVGNGSTEEIAAMVSVDSDVEIMEEQEMADDDCSLLLKEILEKLNENEQTSLSDEKTEDLETQKVLKAENVVTPLALYSEYTIEVFSELNLKKPKLFVEKVTTNKIDDCHGVSGESQTVNQAQEQHQHVMTPKRPSKTFPKPAVMSSMHCKICFRLCTSTYHLKMHIESVHEKKRNFTCDRCSKSFYLKGDLKTHMATHIFVKDGTRNSRRPYRCEINGCRKYYKTKQGLNNHQKRIHT